MAVPDKFLEDLPRSVLGSSEDGSGGKEVRQRLVKGVQEEQR